MRLVLDVDFVQKKMTEKGWDEKQLAVEVGVSKTQVYRVLRGQREPGNEFIAGLSHAFGFEKFKQLFSLRDSCKKGSEEGGLET